MIDRTTERFSLLIRTLLLIICCVLIIPQASLANNKKGPLDAHISMTTLTLAITGISNPISSKTLLDNERSPLRSPGKRSSSLTVDSPDDATLTVAVPSAPVLPQLVVLESISFSRNILPLLSHQAYSWFALAPPASQNA